MCCGSVGGGGAVLKGGGVWIGEGGFVGRRRSVVLGGEGYWRKD